MEVPDAHYWVTKRGGHQTGKNGTVFFLAKKMRKMLREKKRISGETNVP